MLTSWKILYAIMMLGIYNIIQSCFYNENFRIVLLYYTIWNICLGECACVYVSVRKWDTKTDSNKDKTKQKQNKKTKHVVGAQHSYQHV